MDQTNTNTPKLGTLAEITARLAAITPEQYIVPDQAREMGATFVVKATDDIKRLFTLRAVLNGELGKINETGRALAMQGLDDLEKMTVEEMREREARDEPELKRLKDESVKLQKLTRIVNDVFWRDVRNLHPDLASKQTVGIYADWGICWQNREDEDGLFDDMNIGGMHIIEIGGGRGRGHNIGAALEEILRRRAR